MNPITENRFSVSWIETEGQNKIQNHILSDSLHSDLTESLYPQLLTDESRMQEIYDFRLKVWERSGQKEFVNRELFPNGWKDDLDDSGLHWIIINEQDKIIASARLNIFESLEDFSYYPSMRLLQFPTAGPFAFFSRLVVHPLYRSLGLSRQLFECRTSFIHKNGISWAQVFINNPIVIGLFERSGFNNIGKADVNYHSSSLPHSVNVFVKEYVYDSFVLEQNPEWNSCIFY